MNQLFFSTFVSVGQLFSLDPLPYYGKWMKVCWIDSQLESTWGLIIFVHWQEHEVTGGRSWSSGFWHLLCGRLTAESLIEIKWFCLKCERAKGGKKPTSTVLQGNHNPFVEAMMIMMPVKNYLTYQRSEYILTLPSSSSSPLFPPLSPV